MGSNNEENGFGNVGPDGVNGEEQDVDALDAMEAKLQGKIKLAVSKQVEKLIDVANQVEDPTDALAILWEGSDVFRSLKMQRMSKIDDTLPQPAAVQTAAYIGFPLPQDALLPAGFSNLDTADLYQALINMEQRATGEWANLTKPALPPDDPVVKEAFGHILDLIEQVGLVHYEIIRSGLFLHILLSQLYDKHGALRFLAGKGEVEHTLLRYNAHNPHLAIGAEEQALHVVQTLQAIITRAFSYLMSAEFYELRQKKSVPLVSPKTGATTPSFGVYTARVNLVQKMSSRSPDSVKEVEVKMGRGAKKVLQTTAVFIPVTPVSIDVAEARDPLDVLNDISKAVQGLVDKGMDFIYQLKRAARPINFNVYTLQFGEATPLQDNRTMMQKMRRSIYRYIIKDIKVSTTLQPTLFIKHLFLTQAFAGRYGAGPAVDAVSLDPGEEREITHETTVTTKRMTEESDSIFDAKTTSVKDSLEKSRQNQLQQTNTDTAELNQFVNMSTSYEQEDSMSLSAGVSGGISVINFDVDFDWSSSVSQSLGTEQGSNATTNSSREQSVTNTEGMIQNHTEEVTANRERTQTKTERQEEELSQKDKEVRKVKNPNRASPTTIIFCKLIQVYNTVMTTPGFKVMFMNGSVITECAVDMVKKSIMDKYIKPEATETRKAIWELIKASAKVIDHQGRIIDLLDETGSAVRLRGDIYYFGLLKGQHITPIAEDIPLQFYKKYLKGVVLSTRQYTLPQCGLLRRAIVGEPALDETEQILVDLEIEKTRAQTELVKGQVADRIAFRKFFESLTDVDQRIKAGYLLMTPPGDILQKGSLGVVAGMGGVDPTGLSKLKDYLRALKLDV